MIKIMIVDDHPMFREGLAYRLGMDADIEIVAEANNGREALEKIAKTDIDILLTDINMPDMDGMYLLELLREKKHSCKILILSMHDNHEYILSAINNGADGYLLKDVPGNELIRAIRSIYAGKRYFSAEVTEVLSDRLQDAKQNQLTRREQLVLRLVSHGLRDKAIADELNVSNRTIEAHKRNIKEKLQIGSTTGLVRYAIEHGLDK